MIGNVTGNVTGNLNGNATTATSTSSAISANTLTNPRTIAISGAVTGTATSFNGSANISIPATITSGATITSPNLSGTPTYAVGFNGIESKYIRGSIDGSPATFGFIGQLNTSTSALQGITSNQLKKGASITLTVGEWEVYGNATLNFTGVNCVAGDQIGAGISVDSETLITNQIQLLLIPALASFSASPAYAFVTPRIRVSVSGTNQIANLMVQAPTLTAGTITFTSIISANRVR